MIDHRWVPVYEAISIPHIEPLHSALDQSGCKKIQIRKVLVQSIGNQRQWEKRTHAGIYMEPLHCVSIINLQILKSGHAREGEGFPLHCANINGWSMRQFKGRTTRQLNRKVFFLNIIISGFLLRAMTFSCGDARISRPQRAAADNLIWVMWLGKGTI